MESKQSTAGRSLVGLLPLLALLLALANAASAGDNAGAAFSLKSADKIAEVGPGETVTMQIAASGLVGVKEIEIFLAVSPASAFDLAATAFEVPTAWIAPGPPSIVSTDTAPTARANFFSAALTTAADFTFETEATITVEKISIGPSSSERDEFDGGDLALSITGTLIPTAVQESMLSPATTALAQNFPNPFNPVTNIRFDLSGTSSITLTVYDVTGQTIRILVAGEFMEAGTYNLTWDGRNTTGDIVSSGIYFYKLRAGSFASIKKMLLLQ